LIERGLEAGLDVALLIPTGQNNRNQRIGNG
jgi:hypothetical protein